MRNDFDWVIATIYEETVCELRAAISFRRLTQIAQDRSEALPEALAVLFQNGLLEEDAVRRGYALTDLGIHYVERQLREAPIERAPETIDYRMAA